jgi:hypothetical protein
MAYYNEDGTIDYSRPDDRPTAADVFGQRQREAEAALSAGNLSGKALQEAQNALSYATSAVQQQAVFQASFTPEQWNEKLGVRFPPAGTDAGYEYSADNKQRRKKFHDGKGGFYYGEFESNPDYKEDSKDDKATRDAFALLKNTFALYDLADLVPVIEGFMKQGLTANEAIIELRKNKIYQTRFAGNTSRTAAGLNALSEAEYLALEDSYSETLRSYGQQTLLGVDKKARQAEMAKIIGSDISAVEFKDRVSTVVTRVENADPLIKSTLRDFYKITDANLVSYFLKPDENLPRLQEKVTAAEIGSAALSQGGLITDMTSAESLAKFGVDLATARKGYSTISEVLPTATKLSQIYDEEQINYNQQVAEQEVFKGLASAQRKRTQLAEKEIASFKGSSGVAQPGLSTTYMRKSSSAGYF